MLPFFVHQKEQSFLFVTYSTRPTQLVMYVPLQENRSQGSILLIVQYKYLKSCSGDFYSPESDPPHKIMRYLFYYSIRLGFSFQEDHAGLIQMICTTVVPVWKGISVGQPLRWGWVILERTRILSGIQFTTHSIEIFVVETKRFAGSIVHVILARQTCGQRSSKASESKRRALGNYFFERICYMFLVSKCRGNWDLGLAQFRDLRLKNFSAMTKSDFSCVETRVFGRSGHCVAVLQTQVLIVHKPRS